MPEGSKLQISGSRHKLKANYFWFDLKWKAKYGGLGVSEAQRLKALEDENRRLKQLVAEQALDNQALRFLVEKKF